MIFLNMPILQKADVSSYRCPRMSCAAGFALWLLLYIHLSCFQSGLRLRRQAWAKLLELHDAPTALFHISADDAQFNHAYQQQIMLDIHRGFHFNKCKAWTQVRSCCGVMTGVYLNADGMRLYA